LDNVSAKNIKTRSKIKTIVLLPIAFMVKLFKVSLKPFKRFGGETLSKNSKLFSSQWSVLYSEWKSLQGGL